jgi:hypothetical protein
VKFGVICVLPPVIHRICVKDTIQGDPGFHPELSHGNSPFHIHVDEHQNINKFMQTYPNIRKPFVISQAAPLTLE